MDDTVVPVTRAQALAFRLWRHHLGERLPAARLEDAATVGLQDTPPGTAGLALAARADVGPEAVEALVIVPSIRGAPLAVARRDLVVFTAGLDPPDEEAARAVIGAAARSLGGMGAREALDRVSAAVHRSLRDGPRPRDAFHQDLRELLPPELLPWCRGCGSHHVSPSLWRAAAIRGVLAIVGREGRSAVFGLPPAAPAVTDPGAELARRFLRAYAPARPRLLAEWAGLAPSHAAALWHRAGPLVSVDLDGTRAWALEEDREALTGARRPGVVRLLPNLDPLGTARDRELLVADPELRRRVWRALGGPGIVLASGAVAGLWRAARRGRTLVVTVETVPGARAPSPGAMAAEAERIAPFRGAARAELRTGAV